MSARDDYPELNLFAEQARNRKAGQQEAIRALDEIDRLRDLLGPPMTGEELRAAVMSSRLSPASDAIDNDHPTNRSTT